MADRRGGDDGSSDGEKMAREELIRLQRQYRLMEAERLEYSMESGPTASTQHTRVTCYEKERDELLTDLSLHKNEKNQQQDRTTVRVILELLDKFGAHQAAIEHQITEIADLDEQVTKITQRVIQQKLKVQAIFGNSMTLSQSEKHQKILENRLYRYTTNFDTQVTRNSEARLVIKNHLMERGRFHDKYREMKRRIAQMKRQMYDLVDVATSTYDQREECVSKIKSLRERNDKESRIHIQEMREYHHLLHKDAKSRAFMEAKCRSRMVIEDDNVRLKRLQNTKEKYYDDLLKIYRKSFREILAVSGCNDVQSLLRIYLLQEQKNFTKFQYLGTLNSELDFIQRAVTELRSVIEVKVSGHRRMQSDQLKALKLLETQFEEAVEIRAQRKEQLDQSTTSLDTMLASLQNIFQDAKCDKEPIMRLLGRGGSAKIVPENVDLCMTLLEKKIQELQTEGTVLQIRKTVEVDRVQLANINKGQPPEGTSRRPMGGFMKPNISTRLDPNAGANAEEDRGSMSLRPLTYAELRAELMIKFEFDAAVFEATKLTRPSTATLLL